jgi:hypothetical protein
LYSWPSGTFHEDEEGADIVPRALVTLVTLHVLYVLLDEDDAQILPRPRPEQRALVEDPSMPEVIVPGAWRINGRIDQEERILPEYSVSFVVF